MRKWELRAITLALLLGALSINQTFGTASPFPSRWDLSTEEGKRVADFYENKKFYISPNQIHINKNGMFIDFGGDQCRVSEILEDEYGLYVKDTGFWWICRNEHPNPPWRLICQVPGCNG